MPVGAQSRAGTNSREANITDISDIRWPGSGPRTPSCLSPAPRTLCLILAVLPHFAKNLAGPKNMTINLRTNGNKILWFYSLILSSIKGLTLASPPWRCHIFVCHNLAKCGRTAEIRDSVLCSGYQRLCMFWNGLVLIDCCKLHFPALFLL